MQSRLYISIQYVNIFQFLWLEKIRNGGFRRTKCTSKTMYVRNHVRPKPVFGACIMHQRQLNPFLIHVFIKRRQAAYMRDRQRAADGVNIIVQVNFSENATLQNQNEIQTAHWSHNQATLFTAYAWIDVSEDITESMVIVSDDLQHNKQSVHMFMTHIFCTLKAKYPTIEQISVSADGASSQFKQRFLFSNLYEWETEFGVKISWHFFATSHGKGVVDGLGGMVKRTVWHYVRAGAATATTPKAFYEVAVARNPGVRIDYITKEEIMINSQKAKLVESWNETLAVPNTQKLHSVRTMGRKHRSLGCRHFRLKWLDPCSNPRNRWLWSWNQFRVRDWNRCEHGRPPFSRWCCKLCHPSGFIHWWLGPG